MANNPLDLKEFKHYLNFKSDNTGRIQISEPVKFDGAEFVLQQDKMYARDVSYMSEEMDLEFYKGFFEQSDAEYQLPNGLIVDKLGHAIEYLFEYNKDYGFQAQIEYILERNGIEFILGELNFEGCKTDELTYFNCKIVQNTNRAIAKRRDDTKLDGFADKDLDNNDITPIETHNMLLKAKPVIQVSTWESRGALSYDDFLVEAEPQYSISFQSAGNLTQYGVENSDVPEADGNTPLVTALNDLTGMTLTIRDFDFRLKLRIGDADTSIYDLTSDASVAIQITSGSSIFNETLAEISLTQTFDGSGNRVGVGTEELFFNETSADLVYTVPDITSGEDIYFKFILVLETGAYNRTEYELDVSAYNIELTATATAIDTVIKTVRYGDLLRYSLKAVNGMDIIAPELDEGGKYYDLLAFSGNLIRQRDDVPFYFDLKDRVESFQNLTNGDLQINETDAFAIAYDKYYDNVDNGGFLTVPDDSFEMSYNQKYAVNLLEYKFKTYEKDRDESNTLDTVHTEAQFSINNTRVKNTKKIDIKDVFDPFSIEAQRRQVFKETTALEGDDKIHCMDAIPLAPTELGGFTSSMVHRVEDGKLKLLKDSDLPSWALLGFSVGSLFYIDSVDNNGEYTVFEIENNIITLTPNGFALTEPGSVLTTVSYPFSDVEFVNRTSEGFDLIENVLNPNDFGNLRYTIRRNLVEWESYISTCASYIEENPKNTEFKNNGLLTTQYDGGEIYTENADIVLDTIQPAILSPRLYNVDVIVGYDEILDLIRKYEAIATVGGFIRAQGNNGDIKKLYPQKLGYTWSTSVLSIVGEQRVESDVVTITKANGIIYIDEVGYTQDQLSDIFYESNEEFFTIYDVNKIKIINFTKYSKFIVQEETFDNPTDLAQALIDL